MEMAKAMKVGLTIPVTKALRDLFRGTRTVNVRAWVNPQALAKVERWGWPIEPTHLSFTTGTRLTLAFNEDRLTTIEPHDVPLGGMTIQGLALEVLRHFLQEKEGERITLHLGPSSLGLMDHYLGDAPFPEDLEVTITAHDDHDGYTRLKIMGDGVVSVKEAWGSGDYWDAWIVSDGVVEYVGTVEGPRYRPAWLERALEEAEARA
jgi:hypothetical protein